MSLKVYIENNAGSYQQMFIDNGWEITDNLAEADLLQLIGGADVSPELYGEEKHPRTWSSEVTDKSTYQLFQRAQELDIPVAGICRGSQFLSVMGGGKLWQDVDGHANGRMHNLIDIETGIIIEGASSTHHQQHRPSSNAIIIAHAHPQLCTRKENMVGDKVEMTIDMDMINWDDTDVEAFYYPNINVLGYQPHPEFFGVDHPCQMYYFDIISKYLKLKA